MNKRILQNIKWAINDPEVLNFGLHLRVFTDLGFELKNQNGEFEGEGRDNDPYAPKEEAEKRSWVVLTHTDAEVTIKLTENKWFGCSIEVLNDTNEITKKEEVIND